MSPAFSHPCDDSFSLTGGAHARADLPILLSVAPGQPLLAVLAPGAGYGTTYDSLTGNYGSGATVATGAFRQYHDDSGLNDDHFVATHVDAERADWLNFLTTLGAPAPSVPAP